MNVLEFRRRWLLLHQLDLTNVITDDDYKPLPSDDDPDALLCRCGIYVSKNIEWCANCELLGLPVENVSHLPQEDGRPEVSNTGLLSHFETGDAR